MIHDYVECVWESFIFVRLCVSQNNLQFLTYTSNSYIFYFLIKTTNNIQNTLGQQFRSYFINILTYILFITLKNIKKEQNFRLSHVVSIRILSAMFIFCLFTVDVRALQICRGFYGNLLTTWILSIKFTQANRRKTKSCAIPDSIF